MVFRGSCLPMSQVGWKPFTDEDYARLKSWNLNSVLFNWHWGADPIGPEPNEFAPGIYSEANLQKMEQQIALARAHGLYPFIGIQNSFDQQTPPPSWIGWPDPYGGDYINLNTADASGTLGRDRYVALLRMLAHRFPDCGFDVWSFPYHAQPEHREYNEPDLMRETTFYTVTQPLLYRTIREIRPTAPIVLNPMFQGVRRIDGEDVMTGGLTMQPYIDDRNVYYGFNSHNGGYGRMVRLCEDWDRDMAKLDRQWQPLVNFKAQHPRAQTICIEWIGLYIHDPCSERPIRQSRLDWAEAQFQKADETRSSWMYFRYLSPGVAGPGSPLELDGTETAIVDLIKRYAPTPTSLIAQIIKVAVPTALLYALIRRG